MSVIGCLINTRTGEFVAHRRAVDGDAAEAALQMLPGFNPETCTVICFPDEVPPLSDDEIFQRGAYAAVSAGLMPTVEESLSVDPPSASPGRKARGRRDVRKQRPRRGKR